MERSLLEALLIEDNRSDAILLEASLEKDPQVKYAVSRADDLRAGLAQIRERRFDVILLDLDLPDSQGFVTFEQAFSAAKNVPIVVLSGLMDEDVALKAVQAGAQDYLVKGEAGWEFLSRSIRYAIERNNLRQSLGESEEKYRILFESNPLPMWIYDLETLRFLKVNDAAILHYGYSEDEFMAMTIKDIRPPADLPRLFENISRLTGGMNTAGLWNHVKKDGTPIRVEIISHTVEFNGRRGELVLAHDVTERVQAEQELRASEERFGQLANNIQEMFWITDAVTGQELYASPAYQGLP